MYTISMNERKFQETVLYICLRSSGAKSWGKIKLAKTLFYADFLAYKELGSPITGVKYRKLPLGPVPTEGYPVMERMRAEQLLGEEHRQVANHVEQRPVALREPDLKVFSAEEIAILDRTIDWISPMTAHQISTLSHDHPGWKGAKFDEEIPYFTALIETDLTKKLPRDVVREIALQQFHVSG